MPCTVSFTLGHGLVMAPKSKACADTDSKTVEINRPNERMKYSLKESRLYAKNKGLSGLLCGELDTMSVVNGIERETKVYA
jgi:hypothetical protein